MRIRGIATKHGGIVNSLTIIGIFGLLLLTIPPAISISNEVDTNPISFTKKIATAGHIPHSVILIDGDADFASQGWPGAGTDEDPYRIENLDIPGGSDDCIGIWNTRAHFIILNCTVRDNEGVGGIGIHLLNVSNAQLVNNLCEDNSLGIFMQDCGSAAIVNNTYKSCSRGISIESTPGFPIYNNTFIGNAYGLYLGDSSDFNVSSNRFMQDDTGIYMLYDGSHTIYNNTFTENGDTGIRIRQYCSDNTIANNTFIDNGEYAMNLFESGGNTIANNTMIGCGLFLEPRYETYARQEQVTDNTVNGLPLVFLQDQIGGIVPAEAGQIIIVTCSGIVVEDQTMVNCSVGIQLVHSNYSIVTNNTIANCTHGINLERCGPYNLVTNNTCTDNLWTGIYISANGGSTVESTFNTVANNTCMRNNRGIYDLIGENNTIANNNCSWNYDEGIRVHASDGSVLANNTCRYNDRAAITLWDSEYNSVLNNTCYDNLQEGIELVYSDWATIAGNLIVNSGYGIHLASSEHCAIADNTIANFNSGIGGGCDYTTIDNNTCSNGDTGITMHNIVGGRISNNTCINNVGDGVAVWGWYSSYILIADNFCFNNSRDGINFANYEFATLMNNTCANNTRYGLFLDYRVINCSIFWNTFANNSNNVIDDGEDNFIHHNFWSNYTGSDGDADGIGDTPHSIPGGADNEDQYPLVTPGFPKVPSSWVEEPIDQVIEFDHSFRYDLNATAPEPLNMVVSDIVHFTIDGNWVITNITPLAVGVYELRVSGMNFNGYELVAVFTVTVEDTTGPEWLQIPTDQNVEYTDEFRYDLNATDPSGIVQWWLNATAQFVIDSSGVVTNTSSLWFTGAYWLEVRAFDPYDNYASAIFSITVTDSVLPEINHPADVEYIEGQADLGFIIEWTATDDHPDEYVIYRNGIALQSGSWSSGHPIQTDVAYWAQGVYNVTIVVTDHGGNLVSDEVIVTVNPEPVETPPTHTTPTETTTPIFDFGMILGISAGLVVLMIGIVIFLRRRGGS